MGAVQDRCKLLNQNQAFMQKKVHKCLFFCVFYYNPSYLSPKRKYAKRDITDYQPKSGTALAFHYANSRRISGRILVIINICEGLSERF